MRHKDHGIPDMLKPFIIETDASAKGIGAILLQEHPEGERVVEYASRALTTAEKNERCGATMLELNAIVWAMTKKWRHYVEYSEVVIRTDHKALEHHQQISADNPKLLKWILKLQNYNFGKILLDIMDFLRKSKLIGEKSSRQSSQLNSL